MASYSQLAPYGGPGRRRAITAKPLFSDSEIRRVNVSLVSRKVRLNLVSRNIQVNLKSRQIVVELK